MIASSFDLKTVVGALAAVRTLLRSFARHKQTLTWTVLTPNKNSL